MLWFPTMRRRQPTGTEAAQLREQVRDLAWGWARALADLDLDAPPAHPFDAEYLDAAGHRAAVLAHLAALNDLAAEIARQVDATVEVAGSTRAGGTAIGAALGGISRAAVRKRWPAAVAGPTGPREPAVAARGREDGTGSAADGVAERDWMCRARVRLTANVSTGGYGTRRTGVVGEELEMVQRGSAGRFVDTDYWATDEPSDVALFVHTDNVEVVEVLESISAWGGDHATGRPIG